jgi:hypothetical protein
MKTKERGVLRIKLVLALMAFLASARSGISLSATQEIKAYESWQGDQ